MFLQAEREREITIDHLSDIDRLVNESLEMLSRNEDLNTKILPLMEDYLIALRSRDNTPASLLRMDKEHEEEMIDNYTNDIQRKIKGERTKIIGFLYIKKIKSIFFTFIQNISFHWINFCHFGPYRNHLEIGFFPKRSIPQHLSENEFQTCFLLLKVLLLGFL